MKRSYKALDIEEVPLDEGRVKAGQFSPRTLGKLHPLLPKPPFYMIMVAPSGVGKTTLLMNMICREAYYGKKFEDKRIFVWTGTKELDPLWSSPWVKQTIPEDNIQDTFSQQELEQQVNQIKADREKGDMKPYLFIFDDMITEGICSNSSWMVGMLEKLSMWGRHVGISTMILTQKYNMLSRKIRLRDTIDWILFKTSSKETEEITEEQTGRLEEDEFRRMYEHATSEPYSFMHISGATQDPHLKYRKKFESILRTSLSDPKVDSSGQELTKRKRVVDSRVEVGEEDS